MSRRALAAAIAWALLGPAGCGDAPPPPRPDARPLTPPGPAGDPRVAMTQAMDLRDLQGDVADLWPDRPYRVDLSVADGRPIAGLLDLERDGRWETRWTRGEDGALLVATAQGEGFSTPTAWTGARMPGALAVP